MLCIVGTPEIGGLTSIQALEIVRGLRGLNLVGVDVVEVSNPTTKILLLLLSFCSRLIHYTMILEGLLLLQLIYSLKCYVFYLESNITIYKCINISIGVKHFVW